MVFEIITSQTNSKVKYIKKLQTKHSFRKQENSFIVEGAIFVKDILKKQMSAIQHIYIDESSNFEFSELNNLKSVYYLDHKTFKTISSLKSSSGVMAVVQQPFWNIDRVISEANNSIILDQVQNPMNIGAIIRNCAAFGIDAVFYTKGSADPFHIESIRAMAGNYFQVPILEISASHFSKLKNSHASFYTLDINANNLLKDVKFGDKNIFIFGSEGRGIISHSLIKELHPQGIKIDMVGNVDSLNVAVSSGILFYNLGLF
jgi:RNA methyltransferase, TrmH family